MVRIWEEYRREHPEGQLPPILPVIFSHGTTPWTAPLRFSERVAQANLFRPYTPEFAPVLFDVVTKPDSALSGDLIVRTALLLFKYLRRNPDRVPKILSPAAPILTAPDSPEKSRFLSYFRPAIRYIESAVTETVFRSIFRDVKEEPVKQEVMSAAEAFEKRGETRGELHEKRNVLTRQLERKFGLTEEERALIAAQTDREILDRAIDAFVFAETKDAVLSHLDTPE
jgi:hypothetical protein